MQNRFWRVWAISPNQVIGVGYAGIHQFDGSTWRTVEGSRGILNDVWATLSGEAFVVGDSGVLWQFDGSNWTESAFSVCHLSGRPVVLVARDATARADLRAWMRYVTDLLPAGLTRDLLVNGIIAGVGSVIVFLPPLMVKPLA